ncbi:cytochrome P450 81Q32-like [Impatiens glandulifera]|uniref:cytochrome P450 81Q32-like n=1 Tax=Impatiens glandulifera TaxID=253017 RepID=UPI001FB07577|nr:cytochrome P450 81Q32-like [Impatiens glandulifera]
MALLYLAAIAFTIYIFTNRILHKIRNLPPTPFPTLPIIGHLYLFSNPLHRALARISSRHGPIIFLRFGSRPVLLISSPSAANDCFTKNDLVFANRPKLMSGNILGYNYTSLSWSPYGDNWRNLRRIATIEILSSHRLQLLSSVRIDEVRRLICRLDKGSRSGETVNMKKSLFELMSNVMTMMIAGKRYFAEEEETMKAEKFREMVEATFRLSGATNHLDFLPVLKWIGVRGLEKELMELMEKREKWLLEMIDGNRRSIEGIEMEDEQIGGGRKKTMIELLLSLKESEPEYYTDSKIGSIIWVLLAAGTDTSAGTMEWALSLLLNNPKILKKAQDEIDEKVGFERILEESDLAQLPYLHCIITETMRLFPVGPLLVPHESSDDCSVGGYRVPRGTMLLVNVSAIQNDPELWENPNEFRPERFEGLDRSREEFKLFPFGMGRRRCPGEGLAMRMIGLTLGSLIQCFDWERLDKEMVDMTEGRGLTMHKAHPLIAKCRSRPIVSSLLSN